MSVVTVEVCVDGTITRACARAVNRAFVAAGVPAEFPLFSGSSLGDSVVAHASHWGVPVRVVSAASLAGPDKARHTREVTRSRKAQARRMERKADVALAMAV
jgi:hypothetical protein